MAGLCCILLVSTPSVSLRAQGGLFELQPGERKTFYVWCVDQWGNKYWQGCPILWQPQAYEDSGGHLHNVNRPSSEIIPSADCYSGPQGLAVDIHAEHGIGQWEYFWGCCGLCNPLDIWVRHWPLWELYPSGFPHYARPIGKVPGKHVDNHFGTDLLVWAVDQITYQYYGEFYCVPDSQNPKIEGYRPVGVNDMSLEGGGIFDINFNWQSPHWYHSAGNSVDFRCQPNHPESNSIIYVDEVIQRFLRICEQHELQYARRRDPGTSNEHVHCGVHEGN